MKMWFEKMLIDSLFLALLAPPSRFSMTTGAIHDPVGVHLHSRSTMFGFLLRFFWLLLLLPQFRLLLLLLFLLLLLLLLLFLLLILLFQLLLLLLLQRMLSGNGGMHIFSKLEVLHRFLWMDLQQLITLIKQGIHLLIRLDHFFIARLPRGLFRIFRWIDHPLLQHLVNLVPAKLHSFLSTK